jgi:hypothetical protein
LEELHALGGEGYRADIILVDLEKDKKLSMLKQLIVALVKGLNSNPAAIVKKIAGLVCAYYFLFCNACFLYNDVLIWLIYVYVFYSFILCCLDCI